MNRNYLLILFMILGLSMLGQDPDFDVLMSGVVMDSESKAPLPSAHLILNNSIGTTPDLEGKFSLTVSRGDTLVVTHVGYNDYLVPIPRDLRGTTYFLRVAMIPATRELPAITVYRWPATVAQLKEEILALKVEDKERIHIPGSYYGPPKPVPAGVASPVSFLYNKFSKRARQRREFLKKRNDIETHARARARWNQDYVQEITGIEDQKVLLTFMEFCQISDKTLGELSDYELIVAINHCYQDFKERH